MTPEIEKLLKKALWLAKEVGDSHVVQYVPMRIQSGDLVMCSLCEKAPQMPGRVEHEADCAKYRAQRLCAELEEVLGLRGPSSPEAGRDLVGGST